MKLEILEGDNLCHLKKIEDATYNLIYIDPPFNTGKTRKLTSISTMPDKDGDRVGFGGERFKTTINSTLSYDDSFEDYIEDFLKSRLLEAKRILKSNGSLLLHLDYREVHYAKVLCDQIFGRKNFMNEIIWAYDYGGRSKTKWSNKHDTILWYVMDANDYTFNYDEIDRIPYMAPDLVGEEKAAKGKTPTDVHWHTIVPTNGKEKTGYPTQKPLGLLERFIKVHSNKGDSVIDFFAGSGTTGEAALKHERNVTLIDENPEAITVIKKRLSKYLQTKIEEETEKE